MHTLVIFRYDICKFLSVVIVLLFWFLKNKNSNLSHYFVGWMNLVIQTDSPKGRTSTLFRKSYTNIKIADFLKINLISTHKFSLDKRSYIFEILLVEVPVFLLQDQNRTHRMTPWRGVSACSKRYDRIYKFLIWIYSHFCYLFLKKINNKLDYKFILKLVSFTYLRN